MVQLYFFIYITEEHICAVLDNGTAQCWGSNDEGQCGTVDDGTGVVDTPTVVVDLPEDVVVRQIGIGGSHSCVILWNCAVWCWGDTKHGALGNGTYSRSFYSSPRRTLEGFFFFFFF